MVISLASALKRSLKELRGDMSMVTDPKDDPATMAMLKTMSPMVDDQRYAYEGRDALDTEGSRDGDGGVRVLADDPGLGGCGMSAHTPGPWFVEDYGDEDAPALVIHKDSESRICFMATPGSHGDPAMIAADAELIAAAPDMLEILETIENDNGQVPDWLWERIQAVRRRASGRAK